MRPRKRAAPKPKEKKVGDKAPGRKPTYTTSSGEKVSKINLTPTTKSLSCMIESERRQARRRGVSLDSTHNDQFHEALRMRTETEEREKEVEKRKADISEKRRQAAACRRDRIKAVTEVVAHVDYEEEVIGEDSEVLMDVKEKKELGRAQFYNKRRKMFELIPKSQEQRLKLLTLLSDTRGFQSLLLWSKTESSTKTKYHNYTAKSPKVVRAFLETKMNFNDTRKLLRELALACCSFDAESFCNFGLQFIYEHDQPRGMLAKEHKQNHTVEKPYSCDICKKSFSVNSKLTRHKKSGGHVKRQESLDTDSNSNHSNYVDCGEAIKAEDIKIESPNQEDGITEDIIFKEEDNLIDDIKEEIEEDVSVNYFLSIHEETNGIKEED